VKRLLLAVVFSLGGWSCSKSKPVIQSFTADKTTVYSGDTVQLSFAVAGATRVSITPLPGVVTSSPVAVTPTVNVTYTLHAQNDAGEVTQNILISVLPRPNAPTLNSFEALPSQVRPGNPVTLSWSTTLAQSVQLSDGSSAAPADVVASGTKTVAPSATTVYTLTVTGPPGSLPAQLTAKAVARVAAVPHITSFTASSTNVNQGTAVTLSWTGTASRWSLSDGTTTTSLGPATSTVARPVNPGTITYTLTASGVGGTDTKALTINVAYMPGTKLVYTVPTNLTGMQLMLVDVACASPCTAITLRLVPVVSATLRGVALNVPLDSSKVRIDATSGFGVNSSLFAPDSPVAAKALLGSGPLKDTLVIGAAKKGGCTSPVTCAAAADFTVTGTIEVAHVVLTLVSPGGTGIVFDGGKVVSAVQSASGRALGVVAVGKLEVQ
jgi:hypothetical protein